MKSKTFKDAFASVFDMSPSRRPPPVQMTGFVVPSSGSDSEAMREDFRAVGDDMRLALKQYGKKPKIGGNQPHQSHQVLTHVRAQQTITSGPIPNAQEFAHYEAILPGAADRILAMAEANQLRRHESEASADKSNAIVAEANAQAVLAGVRASDEASNEARRSQWMAYSIVLLFLACSVALALIGKEITASVLGGGVLVALVTTFLKRPKR